MSGLVRKEETTELRASSFELRASSFELRASSFELRASSFELRASNFELRTSSFDGPVHAPVSMRTGAISRAWRTDRLEAVGMSRLKALLTGMAVGAWVGTRAARSSGRRPGRGEFDFLALMSHELKTPVNILMGYLELLADDVPEPIPETARVHVHQARVAAQRIAELVNDLLTWARLRSGRERVYPERVMAADIVASATAEVQREAEARGLRLVTEVPDGVWVWTDPVKACQALRALVNNGVKFTPEGVVRVVVERNGGRVLFRVLDTGIGIAPEHLEAIFEPYWQVEASVRRERGGLGLGLTLSRELARLLAGSIEVRSEAGEGSEFALVLPASAPTVSTGG
jgi:signal transduction histidine kinase